MNPRLVIPISAMAFTALLLCTALTPVGLAYSSLLEINDSMQVSYKYTIDNNQDAESVIEDTNPEIKDNSPPYREYSAVASDTQDSEYSAIHLTSNASNNVVGAGESFDFAISIPADVDFCVKLTTERVFVASNTVSVGMTGYTGNPTVNSNSLKVTYISVVNGKVQVTDGPVWFKSDIPVEVYFKGSRGSAIGLNLGTLIVEILMKNTESDP